MSTGLLEGKRIVVTGVMTRDSIAFSAAQAALDAGAEIVLTSFGRVRRMTERAARSLPGEIDVLELDVNRDEDLEALAGELDTRWGRVDGVLHAIAFGPPDALGGRFLSTPRASAEVAFSTSAYSLKALTVSLLPLLRRSEPGASVVGIDFDASVAWPAYDWMGVSKAALEAVTRYLAQYLGPERVRVNLVSAGPLRTVSASGIGSGFDAMERHWDMRAPLGWNSGTPAVVAGPICFLLSDLSAGISGELVHVDGGFHAVGINAGELVGAAP
ncbi:MAG TPA: enoyl-ACP reductase FabI [Solirubrobacteraceae bacterium]|nr:enoyl-ACP reductase FabI [Solirubrobacteraceae bacterium]